jgi:hypothetical protein
MRYGPLSGPAESEYDHCNNGCGGVIDHSARPSLFRGFFWTRRVDLTYASDRAEDRRKVMSGRSGEDVTANDRSSFSLKAFQLFEIGVRNGSQLHQIGSLFCAELISWQDVSCQYFIENKGGKSALAEHCIVTTGENHHPGEDQVLLAVIDNSLCGAVERNDQQGCNDTSIHFFLPTFLTAFFFAPAHRAFAAVLAASLRSACVALLHRAFAMSLEFRLRSSGVFSLHRARARAAASKLSFFPTTP